MDAALDALPADRPARAADVGTGSGCIAVSLAAERPLLRVLALDRSAEALEVARRNSLRHGTGDRVACVRGDLLDGVRGPLDLVVSNPPYVADGETVDPEVLREPREAVFAGPGGLEAYARLAPAAIRVLRPGGLLLLETPGARVEEIAALLGAAGLAPLPPLPDLAGRPRVLPARREG